MLTGYGDIVPNEELVAGGGLVSSHVQRDVTVETETHAREGVPVGDGLSLM